jgi:hypothetical protein
MVYLPIHASAALRTTFDLVLYAMPLAASGLNDTPIVAHGLGAAVHLYWPEVGVDELLLVERRLHPRPVGLRALVGTGHGVDADLLPHLVQAFVLLDCPFDTYLGGRQGSHLALLLTLGLSRCRRLRRIDLLDLRAIFFAGATALHVVHPVLGVGATTNVVDCARRGA